MKKSLKGIIVALILCASMLNVFAVGDYGTNATPQPVKPARPTVTVAPTEAPKIEPVVSIEKQPVVKAETLIAALESKEPVVFENKKTGVAISLSDATVAADKLKDLSLEMVITEAFKSADEVVKALPEAAQKAVTEAFAAAKVTIEDIVVIQPTAQGEFGLTLTISFKAPAKPAGATSENPFLYYVNDKGEFLMRGYAVVKDGKATVSINSASTYFLSYTLIEGAKVDTESVNYKANVKSGVDMKAIAPEAPAATATPEAKPAATPAPAAEAKPASSGNTMLYGGLAAVVVVLAVVLMNKNKK